MSTNTMPPKYITVNGVRKLNPAWKKAKANAASSSAGGNAATTSYPFANQSTALPIVSYPSQKGLFDDKDPKVAVAPSYAQAIQDYHAIITNADDDEIVVEGELVPDDNHHHHGLGELAQVLAKYEIPGGMVAKLLALQHFDVAEILVDDSASMNAQTDALTASGQRQSRWNEAKGRILEMLEIIAYVPHAPRIDVRFMNRPTILEVQRAADESPQAFLDRATHMVEQEFTTHLANGLTPALECIRASLARHTGQRCLRYLMGDGVPNGGDAACRQIRQLLLYRTNPHDNPFTFMSCTNDDAATEWMKECEEVAPYCAEFDDYLDESREILKDQGQAFPYSYGLHLVAQIVAAFNPDDLDAMDESVPFAKQTLDDLLGYQTSVEEYKYYFDSFLAAQRKLPLHLDANQRSFVAKLPTLYADFLEASKAADITAVANYRLAQKAAAQQKEAQRQFKRSQQQAVAADECCIIL